MGGIMRATRNLSLVTLCFAILMVVGACSAGGSPTIPDVNPNLDNYASSIEGIIHQGGGPVSSGYVIVFDLENFQQFNEAPIESDGSYLVGVDEGQYLVFPVTPSGWRAPSIDSNFSNYVNIGPDHEYRMDIELNRFINNGDELVFGFVLSNENQQSITGATISAVDRSSKSDGYGFYAMTVPAGTGTFTVTAEGFFDLVENTREGQGTHDYFNTPFFMLNPKDTSGASMGGAVRDVALGTGLGGVRITLKRPEDPMWVPVQYLTNLGGYYRFYNLPEGIYTMVYERVGYWEATHDGLIVADQDDVIINVFLYPNNNDRATIFGYINNASMPFPISGARVSVSNPLLGSRQTQSTSTGYYSIDKLVPGDYSITVSAPGEGVTFYEAVNSYHSLNAGDNRVDFSLRFIDEGALRGYVIIEGAGGAFPFPPTGVEVTAEMIGGFISGVQFKTTSDGKGVYVFNGLPTGFYLLRATANFGPNETFFGSVEDVFVASGTTEVTDITLTLQ